MSVYILVVDDEPDVEALFRQQFRRDLRSGRFTMEFAPSAPAALARAADIADPLLILILSDINMPGMDGLTLLRRCGNATQGNRARRSGPLDQAGRFRAAAPRDR